MMPSTTGSGTDRAQPWARPFVVVVVVAFVTCGVLGIEAWPLSGFRLFSAPRSDLSTGWRLVAVTAGGVEEPVNVSRLGAAYQGFGFVARDFMALPPTERMAVCGAWLRATAASLGIEARALELVKLEQPLMPRGADGPLVRPRRTVVWTCAANPS
ncbi:MAG: hypothetical protein ACRDG8_08525 [Actinomycetota bacterium]